MASRYSLSAELPATRKSLRRSIHNGKPSEALSEHPVPPPLPRQETTEKFSVSPHAAWNQPTTTLESKTPAEETVRQNLSVRRGASQRKSETAPLKSGLDSSDKIYDDRGYLVLQDDERFGLTSFAFTPDAANDEGRPRRSSRLAWIEGLRGILGLQVLVWTFFRLFAPAVVADRDTDGVYPAPFLSVAPRWQTILRKVLSPLLFDGELQAAFFVILAGRVGLQTFVERRVALSLAGQAFKRPFRFIIPMAITLALVSLVIAVNGFKYAPALAQATQNNVAQPPPQWESVLVYFNSLLFFFSTPFYFKNARATTFIPPAGTLWIVPVLFQQTYVLIILAFALPYTIFRYKNLGMILLILTTAWVGRWSWFTLTGLLFAEWSTIYLQLLPRRGIPLNRQASRFIPAWLPGALFVSLGTLLKYLWIAALPQDANNEFHAHVDGNTGKLNYATNPQQVAYPRYDNWLIASGALYLIELSPRVKRVLGSKPITYLGRWAFSIALISGTLMLSLGSLVWHHLTVNLGWNTDGAPVLAVLFAILIPASLLLVDAYSRVVDDGSLWLANWIFRWIRV